MSATPQDSARPRRSSGYARIRSNTIVSGLWGTIRNNQESHDTVRVRLSEHHVGSRFSVYPPAQSPLGDRGGRHSNLTLIGRRASGNAPDVPRCSLPYGSSIFAFSNAPLIADNLNDYPEEQGTSHYPDDDSEVIHPFPAD